MMRAQTQASHKPISRADLVRSLKLCHQIEDAMWRELRDASCNEQSSATTIAVALTTIRQRCPAWCEQAAWERYADIFCQWSQTFESLEVFWRLRRKKVDER